MGKPRILEMRGRTRLESGDKYTRTTEAIINYLENKIDNVGAKVADTIRSMKKVSLKQYEPTEPMTTNERGEQVP
jgi:hypothetical protein